MRKSLLLVLAAAPLVASAGPVSAGVRTPPAYVSPAYCPPGQCWEYVAAPAQPAQPGTYWGNQTVLYNRPASHRNPTGIFPQPECWIPLY